MLSRLTINNYALLDALDISFPKHLVIITGQTGAGKSILLGALSLLLGAKVDADVICDSSRNCVVEAQFLDEEGQERIVRRVVTPQGRSRSFIDDMPVTLDELRKFTSVLVDIHSQNSQTIWATELSSAGFWMLLPAIPPFSANMKPHTGVFYPSSGKETTWRKKSPRSKRTVIICNSSSTSCRRLLWSPMSFRGWNRSSWSLPMRKI